MNRQLRRGCDGFFYKFGEGLRARNECVVVVSRRTYSGGEIIKALEKWRYKVVDRNGSHVKLRFIDKNTGEKRTVIVPLHDTLKTGTLRDIADQSGAKDFQKFLDAIDDLM